MSEELDKLAREQGVRPVADITSLRGEPVEDFDTFFAVVQAGRREDRQEADEGDGMSERDQAPETADALELQYSAGDLAEMVVSLRQDLRTATKRMGTFEAVWRAWGSGGGIRDEVLLDAANHLFNEREWVHRSCWVRGIPGVDVRDLRRPGAEAS